MGDRVRGLWSLSTIIICVMLISVASASVQSDFLSIINEERKSVGEKPLSFNTDLEEAAYLHSKDMAENNYFSHTSKDGRTFVQRIRNAGYTGYYSLGENIAYHYGSPNASKVFQMWKNSPGHYRNMVYPSFNEMGLGIYTKNGYTYYTQNLGYRKQISNPIPKPETPVQNTTNQDNSNQTNPDNQPDQVNNSSNNNDLSFEINVTQSSVVSSRYRYFIISGLVNEKSRITYILNNRTRTLCSSCLKFKQYVRIGNSTTQIIYEAKSKTQDKEIEKIINL